MAIPDNDMEKFESTEVVPQGSTYNDVSMTASEDQQEDPNHMLTVFEYSGKMVICINETAVEPLGGMLKPSAVCSLSTLVKSTLSRTLVIDWNNLDVGTDLNILPALPPSVKTLKILSKPEIFPSNIESRKGNSLNSFCHKLSNGNLRKISLRCCGFRAGELAALKEQLGALEFRIHDARILDDP